MNIDKVVEIIKNAQWLPFFVFIHGGSCSGKSHLAKLLQKIFGEACSILEMDDHFKDMDDPTMPMFGGRLSFDLPNSYHLEEIRQALRSLNDFQSVEEPIYSIEKNHRIGKKVMSPNKIIIVDGLYASMVSDAIEKENQKITVKVEASTETRLQRRIKRDTARFSWSDEAIRIYFYGHIEPINEMYISKQKAEIIIDGN